VHFVLPGPVELITQVSSSAIIVCVITNIPIKQMTHQAA
jgi:hypothetical protein